MSKNHLKTPPSQQQNRQTDTQCQLQAAGQSGGT